MPSPIRPGVERKAVRAPAVAWAAVGLLASLLILRTLVLIAALVRPMPYWDAWEFMKALPAVLDGRYGLSDLFAFHNEHRIVTTRLLMIADARLFAASGYLPTAALAAALCAVGGVLAAVAAGRDRFGAVAAALAVSLLFSLAHSDNYASGFQVQFPLVDLFAILSVGLFAMSCASPRPAPLLAGAVAADALAIGSMASGNMVLAAVVLVALALRAKVSHLAAFAVPAAAMTAAYLIGYHNAENPPSHDVVGVAHFAVNYLGSALRGVPGASLWLGAALLAGYAAVLAALARAWWRRERPDLVLVWLAGVAAFVAAGAAVTAVGRLGFGLETSISSRYAIQSLLFTACVFLMGWRAAGGHRRASALRLGLAVACLAVSAASTLTPRGLDEWRERVAAYDAAGMAFAGGVFADVFVAGVYPHPELVRPTLAYMAAHRLGPFSERFASLYRPPTNAIAGRAIADLPACAASLDGVERAGPGWLQLSGWAVSPDGPASDGWLLAFGPGGRLLGFGRQDLPRPDVADALHVAAARTGYRLGVNGPGDAPGADRTVTLVLVPEGEHGGACRSEPLDVGPA